MPVDGKPGLTLAPPFARVENRARPSRWHYAIVLLKGLTEASQWKTYEALMVSMESNDDAWIAAVTSYVRNSFGNRASLISTNDVARVRALDKNRTEPWTLEELHAALPQPLKNRSQWKVTASHNSGHAAQAIDGNQGTRFDTGASQAPGMWFQIGTVQKRLPSPASNLIPRNRRKIIRGVIGWSFQAMERIGASPSQRAKAKARSRKLLFRLRKRSSSA